MKIKKLKANFCSRYCWYSPVDVSTLYNHFSLLQVLFPNVMQQFSSDFKKHFKCLRANRPKYINSGKPGKIPHSPPSSPPFFLPRGINTGQGLQHHCLLLSAFLAEVLQTGNAALHSHVGSPYSKWTDTSTFHLSVQQHDFAFQIWIAPLKLRGELTGKRETFGISGSCNPELWTLFLFKDVTEEAIPLENKSQKSGPYAVPFFFFFFKSKT